MKKILSFIMAITMLFTVFVGTVPTVYAGKIQILDPDHTTTSYWAYYEVASDNEYVVNIGFDYNSDKTGIVIKQCGGFGSMRGGVWCTVPREINGLPVTEIAPNAFADKSTSSAYWVKKLILPDTITKIGANAFDGYSALEVIGFCGTEEEWEDISKDSRNTKLNETEIKFGETDRILSYLIEDGEATVVDCNAISSTTLSIPQYVGDALVTKINPNAFFISDIGTVKIPSSVTEICDYAFWDAQIDKFEFSSASRLTKIGSNAFLENQVLTEITIPDTVTEIGNAAFCYCTALAKVELPENLTAVAPSLFASCRSLKSITIPEGVTTIGIQAFSACDSLAEVTIPKSVTTIDLRAFYDYAGKKPLKDIYYGGTEEDWNNISVSADGNEQLSSATIHFAEEGGSCGDNLIWNISDGTLTISGNGRMDDYSYLDENRAPWYSERNNITKVVIEDGVENIGDYAFKNLENLVEATLGNSITSIGEGAFDYCLSLKAIAIPGSVEIIGDDAFSCCTDLRTITIEEGVTHIGVTAFESCIMKEIIIPESVATIGAGAFLKCGSLETVELLGEVEIIERGTFQACPVMESIKLPGSIKIVEETAFDDCCNLRDVYFGGTEEEWNEISFGEVGNDALLDATIHFKNPGGNSGSGGGGGVGPDDKGDCGENLKWYIYGETLRFAGNGDMYDYDDEESVPWHDYRDSITSVNIESEVTSIGKNAFRGFSNITSVVIPDGISSIGADAFNGCSLLSEITLGGGITFIGENAFCDCSNVQKVYYSGTRKTWSTVTVENGNDDLADNIIFDVDSETGEFLWMVSSAYDGWVILSVMNDYKDMIDLDLTQFNALDEESRLSVAESLVEMDFETLDDFQSALDEAVNAVKNNGSGATDISGTCGENVIWKLEDGMLTISGNGEISGYIEGIGAPVPWAEYRDSITKLVIEEGVTKIGVFAFSKLSNLEEAVLCDSITAIDMAAFSQCINLKTVTLPKNLKSLGMGAFANCQSLTEISIPVGISSIGRMAFSGCGNLTDVYFGGSEAVWNAISINEDGNEALLNATIHFKNPGVSVQIINGIYLVTPKDLQNGNVIVFACYNGDETVYVSPYAYGGETMIPFFPTASYDKIKIMVWRDMMSCTPLCPITEI